MNSSPLDLQSSLLSQDLASSPQSPEPSAEKSVLIKVQLAQIQNEHPLVHQLTREYDLPRQHCLSKQQIQKRGLLQWAARCPLGVVKLKDRYLCVTGLRLYRCLRMDLRPSTNITVRLYVRPAQHLVRNLILWDLLLAPGLQSLHSSDVVPWGAAWEKLKENEVFTAALQKTGGQGLAALLGIEKRTFQRRRARAEKKVVAHA